jgi:hypothetical protein
MKQTAVEFLVELLNNFNDNFNLAFKDEIEQALKIENQQIIDAYINGGHQHRFKSEAEKYYNETFNKG